MMRGDLRAAFKMIQEHSETDGVMGVSCFNLNPFQALMHQGPYLTPARPAAMIVIRCDASRSIGYGHVRRCLVLACQYKALGLDVVFVMRQTLPQVMDLLAGHGVELVSLADHDACLDFLLSEKDCIRLAIIDHYEWGISVEKHIFGEFPLLVIDDLCRSHWCDILVDQTCGRQAEDYRGKLHNPETTALVGSAYTLLDPVYQEIESSGDTRHVLVSFGAMDTAGLTLKVLDILGPVVQGKGVQFHVPLSSASPSLPSVMEYASRDGSYVHVYTDLPNLTDLYRTCGLAVGAPGTSLLERIYCGLANLTIVAADNQATVGRALSDLGIASCLGSFRHFDPHELIERFLGLLDTGPQDGMAKHIVDGRGPVRVVGQTLEWISPVILRQARAYDRDVLYRFQREKGARKYFKTPFPPTREEHDAWFGRVMSDTKIDLYIVEWHGCCIGYIRLEGVRTKQISILISSAFQGMGFSRTVLERIMTDMPYSLQADIHPENRISQALFLKAGFTFCGGWTYRYDKPVS